MNIKETIKIKGIDGSAKIQKEKLEKKYGKENVIATYDSKTDTYEIKAISRDNGLER